MYTLLYSFIESASLPVLSEISLFAFTADPEGHSVTPNLGKTVIFMVDSRPFIEISNASHFANNTYEYTYYSIAANINRLYACAHGYDFRIISGLDLKLKNRRHYVSHHINGDRHTQWMKVPASKELLRQGYQTVVFLDSDALFKGISVSLDQMLKAVEKYSAPWIKYDKVEKDQFVQNGTWPATPVPEALMILASDWNHNMFKIRGTNVNTGVMVFRNNPLTEDLLETWWNADIDNNRWNTAFDHEQYVLNHVIIPNERYRSVVSKISDRLINHNGIYIHHKTSAGSRLRSFHNLADSILLSSLAYIHNTSLQCPSMSDSTMFLNFTSLGMEYYMK